MNPCPCGFAGDQVRECRCTPRQVTSYVSRLSGPLRDRLDLTVDVQRLPTELLGALVDAEPSVAIRGRVEQARARQRARMAGLSTDTNGTLTGGELRRFCTLDRACLRLLRDAADRLGLSPRGFDRVRRVARTIADLADADVLTLEHVAEALQFRQPQSE